MLAPPDHPASEREPGSSSAINTTMSPFLQDSHQIDPTSSSFYSSSRPNTSTQQQQSSTSAQNHPYQQHSPSLTRDVQTPAVEYAMLSVNNYSDNDLPSTRGVMLPPSPAGSALYTLPFIPQLPSPSPSPTPISPLHLQQQQHQQQQHQQQNQYSIPESMGHDSIGDFAYIGTFPDQNAGATNNNSNNFSDYEMNPRGYNSFQQTYEVQHLNRAFTPESNASHHQQQQQQQQQQYQHRPQPQHQASYSQPPIVHRAYSEQFVVQQQQHTYPDPALVDTQENETHRTAIATRSRSHSSSSPSSSPPPLIKPPMGSRRKRILWIGAGMVITLLGAIIILVVVLKMDRSNENDGHPGSDGNYDNNFPSTQPPMYTAGTPTSSIPFPRPTSANTNNNPVSAPPLPTPLPPPSQCPKLFCADYFWKCQYQTCKWDGDYQACRAFCSRDDDRCDFQCRRSNSCYRQCEQNWGVCLDYCKVVVVAVE